jgi:hypothetical protein
VLILTTTTRTYRMKTVAADGKHSRPPSVRTVFDRIERFAAGNR